MGALPKDTNGYVIPALTPLRGQNFATSTSAAKNSTAFTANVIRVVSTVECFIKFGGSTVSATTSDIFLPAGMPEYFSLVGAGTNYTHISCILSTGTGTLYISEMV